MYTIEQFRDSRPTSSYDIPADAIRECGAENIERAIAECAKAGTAQESKRWQKALAGAWRWLVQGAASRPQVKEAIR